MQTFKVMTLALVIALSFSLSAARADRGGVSGGGGGDGIIAQLIDLDGKLILQCQDGNQYACDKECEAALTFNSGVSVIQDILDSLCAKKEQN